MKLNPEERKQRIAVLLGDLEEAFKDRMWLSDMIAGTVGLAQKHYTVEMNKCDGKISKIKDELTRLRASH